MSACGSDCASHGAAEGFYNLPAPSATAETASHSACEDVQCHQGSVTFGLPQRVCMDGSVYVCVRVL